jgi:hypothetical protein
MAHMSGVYPLACRTSSCPQSQAIATPLTSPDASCARARMRACAFTDTPSPVAASATSCFAMSQWPRAAAACSAVYCSDGSAHVASAPACRPARRRQRDPALRGTCFELK